MKDDFQLNDWRLCVAPMMDWTDRHCRYFHRLLTKNTRLYTEMVTTGALIHGDVARHLDFDECEHPVALQLGGSDSKDLAYCARLAEKWGYDEVNLNCGCPSERVQQGAFGACLMLTPNLVSDGIKAMQDVVSIPITVKHRLGVDRQDSYAFTRDFVGLLDDAGCKVFIVHARSAWLHGLSPKENREIPPLRYEWVYQLKKEFPELTIVLNGGVRSNEEITVHLQNVDGVMVGRHAYHYPWSLSSWDANFCAQGGPDTAAVNADDREAIESQMVIYMSRLADEGMSWAPVARHMLGLWNDVPGARKWRQVWSDSLLKSRRPEEVARLAQRCLGQAAVAMSQ